MTDRDTDPSALDPDTDPGGHQDEPSGERVVELDDRARDGLLVRLTTTVEVWRRELVVEAGRAEARSDALAAELGEIKTLLRGLAADLSLVAHQDRRLGSEVAALREDVDAIPCRRPNGGVPDGCEAAE